MNKTELIATLTEAHRLVREFREDMHLYFPAPSREDCMAFAVTEVGEAVDAVLRQNPLYKRNNSKRHNVEAELAQTAMMLLSTIPFSYINTDWLPRPEERWELKYIAQRVVEAWALGSYRSIIFAVATIATHIDLLPALRFELSLLRQKHLPKDDGPASLNEVANESVISDDSTERLVIADYKEDNGL